MTIVKTPRGGIRGRVEGGLYVFKGIPYAEPIGGRALWLPPKPRSAWKGVMEADRFGPTCIQFGSARKVNFPSTRVRYLRALGGYLEPKPEGDDCLLLNVWSPTLDHNARLPVMVYIHGGGFSGGAADELYNAERFARKDVVAVVIQYRLGPPGFLHATGLFDGDFGADNRAFLDQLCALQWVQESIEKFGGDPTQVTIFGESAGAFAAYQLAASPLSKGLFKRVIGMGGMAQTCAPADDYHALAKDVLLDVGIKPGDEQALISLDRARLMKLQSASTKRVFRGPGTERYGILGQEKINFLGAATGTDFLPLSPLASYGSGTPNQVEMMLGTCSNDGGLFSLMLPVWRSLSAKLFSGNLKGLVPQQDMAGMQARYRVEMPGASKLQLYDRVNNDAFYWIPTMRAADAHAAGHPGKTYLYRLDYDSAIPGLGAIHGIDVALLFRTPTVKQLLVQDEQTSALTEQMLEAWTQFAKTGAPQAPGIPAWQAYDETSRSTMVFNRSTRLVSDLDANLRRLWQQGGAPDLVEGQLLAPQA